MDFNGMVRHYYLRGGHLADIRVNLAEKGDREQQSHAICCACASDLEAIAAKTAPTSSWWKCRRDRRCWPPWWPKSTGPDLPTITSSPRAAREKGHGREPFVVDIDDMTETARDRIDFIVDKEKAALHGVHRSHRSTPWHRPGRDHAGHRSPGPGERQPLMDPGHPAPGKAQRVFPSQLPVKTPAAPWFPWRSW
jgi:hypothetical protein